MKFALSLTVLALLASPAFAAPGGNSPPPNAQAGSNGGGGQGKAQGVPQRNEAPPPGFSHNQAVQHASDNCVGSNGQPCARLATSP